MTRYRISVIFLVTLILLIPAALHAAGGAAPSPDNECVVLLHGLGRDKGSMARLEGALKEEGYEVVNLGYPSLAEPIAELASHVGRGAVECQETGAGKVHFVAHSLGGILVRYYLKGNSIDGLGRVVMITPPNKGSEVAEFFKKFPGYRRLYGVAGEELGVKAGSVPAGLGPVGFEAGVIAGDRVRPGPDSVYSLILIPGPDDGKVSVESARVEGMADFIVLDVAHRYAPDQGQVIGQTINFIKDGAFKRE